MAEIIEHKFLAKKASQQSAEVCEMLARETNKINSHSIIAAFV
ncbi:MAG TPA: hypothetical protein VMT62_14130 [Syntrophorhabdaceae bacterium]|nr:hypothetical protein [Syntrophorhabdaceae bacterium]